MKLDVLNIKGESTGRSVELPADIFSVEPNEHAVYLAVKQYNAAQRQGTHKAKERGEIKGSTRKIKKQKGTGTARAGSMKNPLFRGGGRVFGPRPRKYDIKLNKKVKSIARASALSYKAAQGQVKIVEDFNFDAPKTKSYAQALNSLGAGGKKSVLVLSEDNTGVYLSSRNIQGANVTVFNSLNTYEIMNANVVLIAENAVSKMGEAFAK